MAHNRIATQLLIAITAVTVLISGCTAPIETATPVASETYTPQPTLVPTSIGSPVPVGTATVQQTITPQPTMTATLPPNIPPTWTPLPTLPPEQATEFVRNLLQNNAGCRLPCWWGITPGRTSWQEAEHFLLSFAYGIRQGGSPERPRFTVYFPVPLEIYPTALSHDYKVIDGVVQIIEVIPGNTTNYTLAALLRDYGLPDEVWLRTYSNDLFGDLPFDVVLFYPAQGIMVRFALQGIVENELVRACPQSEPAGVIGLWAPERQLTFIEAANETINIREESVYPYRALPEVTAMDVQSFYEIFQDLNAQVCIETPSEYWEAP